MIKKMIKKNSVIRKIVGENTACEEAIKWLTKHKNKLDNWLWEHCDRPDWMVWFLQKSELPLPKEMWVKIASACAEANLGIYEEKYPYDVRPRQAIEAAKGWLVDASAAAARSTHAADAAYGTAADAAADAADAADAAAVDAADAASSASTTFADSSEAYAAAYAAYASAAAANSAAAADAATAAYDAAVYAAYASAYADSSAYAEVSSAADRIRGIVGRKQW